MVFLSIYIYSVWPILQDKTIKLGISLNDKREIAPKNAYPKRQKFDTYKAHDAVVVHYKVWFPEQHHGIVAHGTRASHDNGSGGDPLISS